MPFVRGGDAYVRLANPMAEDESYLRRELLETLARRAEHNLAQHHRDVRLFEIGSVFLPSPSGLPREEMRVAAIVMGHRHPPHWSDAASPDFDEWDAKGFGELIATTVAYFILISAGGESEYRFRVPIMPQVVIAAAAGVEAMTRRARRLRGAPRALRLRASIR